MTRPRTQRRSRCSSRPGSCTMLEGRGGRRANLQTSSHLQPPLPHLQVKGKSRGKSSVVRCVWDWMVLVGDSGVSRGWLVDHQCAEPQPPILLICWVPPQGWVLCSCVRLQRERCTWYLRLFFTQVPHQRGAGGAAIHLGGLCVGVCLAID